MADASSGHARTVPTRCRARSRPASSGWANAWSSASRARSITAATPAFLIVGETASMLVETGHPEGLPDHRAAAQQAAAAAWPPLKYLFVTHQETPHCGGLGRVLTTLPGRDPVSATSATITSRSRNTSIACA